MHVQVNFQMVCVELCFDRKLIDIIASKFKDYVILTMDQNARAEKAMRTSVMKKENLETAKS